LIGVFDSGFGGLTVLSSLLARLPQYDYLYLGDSARAPYGSRSLNVVYQFTREAVEYLFAEGCPLVLLACNTASALALRTLQQLDLPRRHPDRRILGVVRPSAEALAALPPGAIPGVTPPSPATGTVAVLGTAGTIASGSYRLELAKLAPGIALVEQACPLWVPLVEAGETSGPGTDYFLHKYLDPMLAPVVGGPPPSRILLGCTHYPLLLPGIRAVIDDVDPSIALLTQGAIVAERLADWLDRHPEMEQRLSRGGARRYDTTDDPAWFAAQGARVMNQTIAAQTVRLRPVG
jgi:glutamate racemase